MLLVLEGEAGWPPWRPSRGGGPDSAPAGSAIRTEQRRAPAAYCDVEPGVEEAGLPGAAGAYDTVRNDAQERVVGIGAQHAVAVVVDERGGLCTSRGRPASPAASGR